MTCTGVPKLLKYHLAYFSYEYGTNLTWPSRPAIWSPAVNLSGLIIYPKVWKLSKLSASQAPVHFPKVLVGCRRGRLHSSCPHRWYSNIALVIGQALAIEQQAQQAIYLAEELDLMWTTVVKLVSNGEECASKMWYKQKSNILWEYRAKYRESRDQVQG